MYCASHSLFIQSRRQAPLPQRGPSAADFKRAIARASTLADAQSEVAKKLGDLSDLRRGLENRLENIDGPLRDHQNARAKVGTYMASWKAFPGTWNGEWAGRILVGAGTGREVAPKVRRGSKDHGDSSSRPSNQGASEGESAEADDRLRGTSDEERLQWERAREQREAVEA